MNEIPETDDMPIALRLAAIVTLLSSCALRGPTATKAAALRTHLDAAARFPGLEPTLRDTIEQALAGWTAAQCHPASVAVPLCPLTHPGQSLH